mmetsp:Transcript_11187/g.37301  ORF Transcript_11187/g.37301 Transcript_11187/m.37301 type:complete len:204 (-) Transcript_11187:638-1249(-)
MVRPHVPPARRRHRAIVGPRRGGAPRGGARQCRGRRRRRRRLRHPGCGTAGESGLRLRGAAPGQRGRAVLQDVEGPGRRALLALVRVNRVSSLRRGPRGLRRLEDQRGRRRRHALRRQLRAGLSRPGGRIGRRSGCGHVQRVVARRGRLLLRRRGRHAHGRLPVRLRDAPPAVPQPALHRVDAGHARPLRRGRCGRRRPRPLG